MQIKESARKHGVNDDDMLHAMRNALFVHFLDGYRMVIGPARDGQLLEVGVNSSSNAIFHAMTARGQFLRR